MLPTLTTILGLKRMTNNSTRVTAIRAMKEGGASDRDITTVSGHRTEASLKHYDPIATNKTSHKMAMSIANSGLKAPPATHQNLGLMLPPVLRKRPNSQKNYSETRINPFIEEDELSDEFFNSQEDIPNAKQRRAMELMSEMEKEKEALDDPDWQLDVVSTYIYLGKKNIAN